MPRKFIAIGFVLALVAGWLIYNSDAAKGARIARAEIAHNVAARGGSDALEAVDSLRLSGMMDLGQGMHVPYVLEQKRPGKMCLEFEFDKMTSIQCVDGDSGWKRLPYRGRNIPEPMTDEELREMAGGTEIGGLLFNAKARGVDVRFAGKTLVNERPATKLEVTLPSDVVRWVYVDEETGLDVKLETRSVVRGEERLVETFYYDWQESAGIVVPRRQETLMDGAPESYFLTVEKVEGNPQLADSRFKIPVLAMGTTP